MAYVIHLLNIVCIYMILSLSLNIIIGVSGQFSIAQGAFMGIGAYTSALLALKAGIPFWASILLSVLVSVLIGFVVGLPSLRLRGDFLGIATFGFGIIAYSIFNNLTSITGGPMGMPGIPQPEILGFSFDSPTKYLILTLSFLLITILILRAAIYSPFGRILKAIREDEKATQVRGIDIARYKIIAFLVGSGFAGIAGSLYAHYITFIDPSSFTIMESITILTMVVIGGMGNIRGPIVGAAVLISIPEILRFLNIPGAISAPLRQLIYGILLILIVTLRPKGLWGDYYFGGQKSHS
ncbi:MAG: branched-chain amino acid ABC transporter permease [Candidatus Eremiobacteraeota bacterium]|nr:branched-chain amino acid ABC transporter permease [Candidatus Eremiobacteraeota bacterium]